MLTSRGLITFAENSMEKIINGFWDGLPIWRYKTAAEALIEDLQKQEAYKKEALEETEV